MHLFFEVGCRVLLASCGEFIVTLMVAIMRHTQSSSQMLLLFVLKLII